MTRSIAWIMTASLAIAFMLPSSAVAVEFFSTPFRYQWKSQSGENDGTAHIVRANAGDTVAMSLTLTNRSIDPKAKVIYGTSALTPEVAPYRGAHELRLGTSNPHDKIYDWVDSSSFISNPDGGSNRLAAYNGVAVNPGEDLSFNFNLKIKSGTPNGTYDFYVGVVREYDAWAKQVDSKGRLLPGEDIFWRVVVGGGSVTPATGGLTVNLSSGTPAAGSVAKSGNANFTKMTLTAAAGATVKISSLYVTRSGMTADSDLENVKILKADGTQVGGTAGGFNANHKAQIFFTPALEIVGSQDFYIRAGFASTVTTGLTAQLGIAENADIVSNATSVSGAPFYGNYMTAVAVTIGTVTVSEDGSIVDTTPDVGDVDVITNAFKITAGSTEGVLIDRITVMKSGSSETADTKNVELWDVTNNKTLGTVESWSADGKASWPVNLNLGKGDNIRLRVQLDVIDGVGLTVNTDIADGSDYLVFAKGISYGFYITPAAAAAGNWTVDAGTGGTNNLGQGDKNQTINSGALVISKSGSTPATGNIAVADNQLLGVWDFDVKGESQRVSAVTMYGNLTDSTGTTVTYVDMTNARLVDMATGNILSGPIDGADDASAVYGTAGTDAKFAFTNTFVLPVGVTKVGFKVRLSSDWANADTIVVTLNAAADVTVKGIITNNSITPGGSYGIPANTMTVKGGALVIETLGIPATSNVVINTQDMIVGTYSFNAVASGENVLVSSFTVTDTMDATSGESDDFTNWELWADLTSATSSRGDAYETKISNTETPTSDAGDGTDTQAFTLTSTLEVPKGETRKVALIADVAAGATALGTHQFTSTTTACASVTGKDTGSDIAETGTGTAGTLTIQAAGSITTAVADSNPDAALIIANATTFTTLGAFKLMGTDEAFNVTKLSLDATTGYESLEKVKISYPTKTGTGTREVSVNAAAIAFDNIDMYVPKNGSAVVTASATTKRIGTGMGGTFNDAIKISLDMDANAEFAATGESSGTALNGGSTGTTNRDGNTMYMYNSAPTVVAANSSGSGTIVPGGAVDLYKFKVTADPAGAVAVKRFTLSVFITDASTTTASTADLGGFTFLRDGTDITSTAQITQISNDGGATHLATPLTIETDNTNDLENNTSYWVQVTFANTPATSGEQVIAAGQTVTYTLRAICGTGFTTTDAFSTSLLGDTVTSDGYAYLSDVDAHTGVQQVVILQNDAGTQFGDATMTTTEQTKFVWSDISVLAHTTNFDDDGVVETGQSADWTNSFLVKNFPLSGYGYTL
ncbi:MAG: hypothetical protein WC400_00595 [Patescibacteria group bacterium]